MTSPFACLILSSLLLFANTTESRKDPGEYWTSIMKDQPMPEAIQGLVHHLDSSTSQVDKKTNCHTATEASNKDEVVGKENDEKPFVKDFDPRPNVSAYNDDDVGAEKEKTFVKDFEPRPNISAYNNDVDDPKEEKTFVKDFEPRPNISAYNDDVGPKEEKTFVKDFKPRQEISVYHE